MAQGSHPGIIVGPSSEHPRQLVTHSSGAVSQAARKVQAGSSGYGTVPPAHLRVTPRVVYEMPRGVANKSGVSTGVKGSAGGKEVLQKTMVGKGFAHVSWVEGMELDYNNDIPEECESIEVESEIDYY
ncbi:hypothetical protein NDU88_005536 [Pleurodeles waltl]|uniref:Uncharacterized protein n=1 Tax=Pleurodeles waltl TaxID=8319 RepID=A0AAV7TAS4_PLEWA|nr:hypothetical protein NDU88_005536 [Pleurodeles waltl]